MIPCERRCGEFVAADKLDHHMQCLCIKRPFPPIRCRLGCGELFAGGAHEILKCEEAMNSPGQQEQGKQPVAMTLPPGAVEQGKAASA